jgi:hydrogenase expression/formation protein HypE
MEERILLGHGSGGKMTHELIATLFFKYFQNSILDEQTDSSILRIPASTIAFTTDSFVVDPIFFPGGDIGKLAVAGTVNDLAVSGATPRYLSASFIIEEGFSLTELERIVISMAEEAKRAGVKIVTGDTKVVNKGKSDKVFINTSGIGELSDRHCDIGSGRNMEAGDKIIINGTLGDHGMSIMAAREGLQFETEIESDCACLNKMIKEVLDASSGIRFMRDATRGGLATVLCELVSESEFGVEVFESSVPVNENVRGMCELLGFDPLYVANEGKVLMVVKGDEAEKVLATLQRNEFGQKAAIIGEINSSYPGKAWLTTTIGGRRIIDMLAGEQLPRIC